MNTSLFAGDEPAVRNLVLDGEAIRRGTRRRSRGLVEYCLLLAFVAIIALVATKGLATSLGPLFATVSASL